MTKVTKLHEINNDKSNRVTNNYVTTTKVTKLHEIK